MWPWTHLAIGYLIYSAYTRYAYREVPHGLPVVWLAIGTQFPDLVDKPLAYWVAVLPEGRSLTHSIIGMVPLCAGILYLGYRKEYWKPAVAFVIGYVPHPFADGLEPFLNGNSNGLTFLAWPVLPVTDYEAGSFAHHYQELLSIVRDITVERVFLAWNDMVIVGLWITFLTVLLWIRHGMPPREEVMNELRYRNEETPGR